MATRWADRAHVMWSARGQWLPDDARGFRDHGHCVHSSGDYRSPPHADEHRGLRNHAQAESTKEFIPPGLRSVPCEALASKWAEMGVAVRSIALDAVHAHALICAGPGDAKPLVARAKQRSSHRVRHDMPETTWAQGCEVVRVREEAHWRVVVDYIAAHANEGATVWEPEAILTERARRS